MINLTPECPPPPPPPPPPTNFFSNIKFQIKRKAKRAKSVPNNIHHSVDSRGKHMFILLFKNTRLLGCFAHIFFNCEHFLFIYIVKQKQTEKLTTKISPLKLSYLIRLSQALCINIPAMDPCLYVMR